MDRGCALIAVKPKTLRQVIKCIAPHVVLDKGSVMPACTSSEYVAGSLSEAGEALTMSQMRLLAKQGVEIIGIWTAGGKARIHFARERAMPVGPGGAA